jgi:tetratricopeptide (TPR) repeat protein
MPLARLYAGAGRADEALGAIDTLVTGADAATRLAAWREGARIADQSGRKLRAVAYLRRILAQDPRDADARRILAALEAGSRAGR